jgi:hypothetical protein
VSPRQPRISRDGARTIPEFGEMKRTTSYVRSFRADPYGWQVYLFVDRTKMCAFLKRRGIRTEMDEDNDGITISHMDGQTGYVGVFDGEPGTLAHEMTHLAMSITFRAGIKLDGGDNEEPLAYLIGHFVDQGIAPVLQHNRAKRK